MRNLKFGGFSGELDIAHKADGSLVMTHQPHGDHEDWPRCNERYFGDPAGVGPFGDDYHFGAAHEGAAFGAAPPWASWPHTRTAFGAAPSWAAFGYEASDISIVKQVQTVLNSQGYGPLVVDGKHGPKTGAATLKFQIAKKINPSGVIDDTTLVAMGLAPTGKPVAPEGPQGEIVAALATAKAEAQTVAGTAHVATGLFAKIEAALAKVFHKGA